MVKITLLSERKRDSFHAIMAFYDFKGKAVNDCDCGKFVYEKSDNYREKRFRQHTTSFNHEELSNLKKALLED